MNNSLSWDSLLLASRHDAKGQRPMVQFFRYFLLLSQNCNQDRYCTLPLDRLISRSAARSLALALALSLVALLAFLDLELSAFGSAKVSLLRGRLAALFSVRPLNSKDLEAISGMLALL